MSESAPLPAAVEDANLSVNAADAILLRRILQRDEVALGALYDRYGSLVYSLALHMIGDRVRAEATVLAVFETIWRSATEPPRDRTIVEWVFVITRRYALTQGSLHERPAPQLPAEQASAHARSVGSALAALTPGERAAVELAYYRGLHSTQLAAQLGEPVQRVKAHLREGLTKLAALLARDGFERTA